MNVKPFLDKLKSSDVIHVYLTGEYVGGTFVEYDDFANVLTVKSPQDWFNLVDCDRIIKIGYKPSKE